MKKTLIIYSEIIEPLKFGIVDGDYSRFNNVVINSFQSGENVEDCIKFLFADDGKFAIELTNDISLVENKQWDKVAIITFLP